MQEPPEDPIEPVPEDALRLARDVAVAANLAPRPQQAIRQALAGICTLLGFPVGHVWSCRAEDGLWLVSSGLWHSDDEATLETLRRETDGLRLAPGEEPAGVALATRAPAWNLGLPAEPSCRRSGPLRRLGLRAGIALPVLIGIEVAAVLEFFSAQARAPGTRALDLLTQIGVILGRALERDRWRVELESAARAAEASARSKSEFLSIMSHELRTPLAGILGLTELLRGTKLDGEQDELADGIEQSGRQLLGLVESILEYTDAEGGSVEPERCVFDVPALCNALLVLHAPAAGPRRLGLAFDYAPGLPRRFRGDPVRLRHALGNLVHNAVRFTERGGVSLRVRPLAGTAGAEGLRFEVHDTGPGIAEEDHRRIFEPFVQLDGSDHRRHGGTGLGLSVAARLVRGAGGRLGVDSVPGSGSCFWIEVPLAPCGS